VQSLERVFEIISVIENSETGMCSVSKLSKTTDLPPSTIHRILRVLLKHKYVYQDRNTKKYRLGSRFVELGLQTRDSLNIREIALPVMENLTKDTNETSYLTIQNNFYGIYIEKVETNQSLKLYEPLGDVIPLHAGASRKVILAHMPENYVDQMHNKGLLIFRTKKTVTDSRALKKQLLEIRKKGVAITKGENYDDAIGIAAVFKDSEGYIGGSISIAGPVSRIKGDKIEKYTILVKESARQLSRLLGYTYKRK